MENTTLYPNIQFNPAYSKTISTILDELDAYDRKLGNTRINIRPFYQRGEAWDTDFKEKLIYSLVTNYPIGNFILRRINAATLEEPTHEVVDGQQRLLTIKQFIRSEVKLSTGISRDIIRENRRFYEYDMKNNINDVAVREYKKFLKDERANIKLSFKTFPSIIQNQILGYNINVVEVICDDESISQYFRFIQNQERLRAGEIINSIPDSDLKKYLDMVISKDEFLEKINWNESRKEFEKIFYSMAGIFDNKINFGTTDNSIINYVTNFNGLSDAADKSMINMINAINALVDSEALNTTKFSKRLLKFFFLSAGYGDIDYTIDTKHRFEILCNIESKLPLFNSLNNPKFDDEFEGYDKSVIEKYNLIFNLGRGSHSPKATRETMKVLKEIFEYEISK